VPWGRLSLWKWVPGISNGVKAAGAFGWRPTTLVVPKVKKIWGLKQPLGPPRPVAGDLYFILSTCNGEVMGKSERHFISADVIGSSSLKVSKFYPRQFRTISKTCNAHIKWHWGAFVQQYYIFWVCVVALGIHHAMRMRHNVNCGLSGSTIIFFSYYLIKDTILGGGKLSNIKFTFWLSPQLLSTYFHKCRKN